MLSKIGRRLIMAGYLLALVLGMPSSGMCQQNSLDALDREVTINTSNLDVKQILEVLSQKTKLPIGFEQIPAEAHRVNKVNISVRRGPARDVLAAIVRADPRYKWEIVNGAVNVMPTQPQEGILDTVVHNFHFDNKTMEEVSFALINTPEVSAKLKSMGITQDSLVERMGPPLSSKSASLTFPDSTVREILNELLRKGLTNYWVVERYTDYNSSLRILL